MILVWGAAAYSRNSACTGSGLTTGAAVTVDGGQTVQ